jgi:8-oxo-dGTP pyrophosphatase MutT (NUDIX family)
MNHVTSNRLVERVRRLFGGAPCRLQVAALPWRKTRNGVEVMLVTSRDTGRWVLPKGWPEFGEQFCEAAAREAGEEAGLKGTISAQETGRYYYSKGLAGGDSVRCEVMVYPFEVANVADKWKEKGERKRKWVSPAKAAQMVAESDLGEVILAFAGRLRAAAA